MRVDPGASIAIIGAGLSGLATARMLLAEGYECTVFERNARVGGVWADGYSGFGVQVPRDLYEFPDWPLPADAPSFTPGPVFQRYLEDYARAFDVLPRVRFDTEVLSVVPHRGGNATRVTWRGAQGTGSAGFDLVVICVGMFSSRPNLPRYPGQAQFGGEIIHNSAFKSREQAKGRRVLVVGYGKSATDAALECAAPAARTTLLVRTPYWPMPRKLLGLLPLQWVVLNRLTCSLIPPYQRPSAGSRWLHGAGRPLTQSFWRSVEALVRVQCRLGPRFGTRVSLVPSLAMELSTFRETTMVPRPELYREIRSGGIRAARGEIASYEPGGVVLRSGERIDADLVILATGWRTDYEFLDDATRDTLGFDDDGCYLYRHVLHPDVPNLAFVGCNAVTYQAILTSTLQARWLVELLKGTHRLPSTAAMHAEIEDMRAWKRSWMPPGGARGAMLGLHQQHYHDELLADMGIDPRLKRGRFAPVKELLAPYVCRDYADVARGGQGLRDAVTASDGVRRPRFPRRTPAGGARGSRRQGP